MSEKKMLPCPACGKDNYMDISENPIHGTTYVRCANCMMQGPAFFERDNDAAIKAWNALPRALCWTKERPTTPGWYWWRAWRGGTAVVTEVCYSIPVTGEKRLYAQFVDCTKALYIDQFEGEWAGPIPEPKEE